MKNGEFIDIIIKDLKAYRASGVMESVERNKHMNQYEGERVSGQTVDAILVDFVNFIGNRRGMDLGLYTVDLDEPVTNET